MSIDRELLELAAKAAGLKVRIWDGHTGVMCAIDDDRHGSMWMPLTDDGDALRLAVKLTMMIDYITKPPLAHMSGHVVAVSSAGSFYELGFTEVATRRAIVRAAAEIGKTLT